MSISLPGRPRKNGLWVRITSTMNNSVMSDSTNQLPLGLELGEALGAGGELGENRLDRRGPEWCRHPMMPRQR